MPKLHTIERDRSPWVTLSLRSYVLKLVLACSFLCLHSIRLGAWSPGRLMLQRLAVGLTPPPTAPGRRGSVLSDSSIPLASDTEKEPSALTRYELCA